MCNIYIVDAPCGTGKTSAAIQMMNDNKDDHYLFITPFLKEVTRIKEQCTSRSFYEPQEMKTKLNGLHWLLDKNKDIASTHSLFLNFNDYTIQLLKQKEYILILDEVADVVEIMDITKKDLKNIIENYAHVEDGLLIWDDMDYEGKFSDIMRMSLNKCVGIYGDTALIWCFPIEIFKLFKEVYILTYLFNAQIQKYYYDFYDISYKNKYVDYIYNEYSLTDKPVIYPIQNEYKNLITICDNEKLNNIGDLDTSLSVSWFIRDKFNINKPLIKALRNNTYNYFRNIVKSSSELNMWTTFKPFKKLLQSSGYSRGFVSVNARATNEFRHKIYLAYCANMYMNPVLKQFFNQKDIKVNEELYSLSELIQWIWRSAIREDKPINIYIPSSRMRNLLIDWLNNENI